MGSILSWWPWDCDLSQLFCLRLDMIHSSNTVLASTLPPQAPSQAPWLSDSSSFSSSFQPETTLRRQNGGSFSGWSLVKKRWLKVTFFKSSPCSCWWYTRQLLCYGTSLGAGSAPGVKASTRLAICMWSICLFISTSLKQCREALSVVTCPLCRFFFLAVGLIHSPKNQTGFGSDSIRGLYCISAHRNTKEQSLVICSIISSFVP